MPRFFLEPTKWETEPSLEGDEAKHCARVMRAKAGDHIGVFDGEGRSAAAEVLAVTREHVALRLGEIHREPAPKVEIVLAQAVIKGKAMDWLLQKVVELGVTAIQPLSTDHAVVRPGEGKEDKWQRVVLEACKQCGRSRMPKVLPIVGLDDFLSARDGEPMAVASLEGGPRLRDWIEGQESEGRIGFLIGPEGDFSRAEYSRIGKSGIGPVSLGATVLRSETAAIHCVSAASYAFS